ncbi:hypothetical protein JCM10212_003260 [Sporobolomyces blumeae]
MSTAPPSSRDETSTRRSSPPDSTRGTSTESPFAVDDYDSDNDTVVAVPLPRNATGSHRRESSSAALLDEASSLSVPPSPRTSDRQRRLRSYEDDDGPGLGFIGSVKAFVDRNTGLLFIALAQLFFSIMNLCVKILVSEVEVPIWELILVRMAVTAFGCCVWLKVSGDPHPFLGPPGVRVLLCIRGIVGFFGLFPVYFVLKYLSLSDATTISFLSPVLVGLLAFLVLKEPYSRLEAIVGCTSILGTVFIAKPSFLFPAPEHAPAEPLDGVTPEQRTMAVLVALIGVCGAAGAYLIIRVIGHRASATHSILYFSTYSCVVSLLYPIFFDSPPVFYLTGRFFVLLAPIGIFGFFAQVLLTMGLQREKAGRGTLAVYTHLIFAMILERVFFHKYPDGWSLLGATIIVGGALRVALAKTKPKPIADGARRKSDDGGARKAEDGQRGLDDRDDDSVDDDARLDGRFAEDDEENGHTVILGRPRAGSSGVAAARGLDAER